MNSLRLKLLALIITLAVIVLAVLSYYLLIPVDLGILLAIIPVASPFLFYGLDYYQKPKVNLKIEKAQFIEKKISDKITGHQLKVQVVNKGKRICFNVNAYFVIKDKQGKKISLMNTTITNNNERESASTQEEPFSQVKYEWFNANGKEDSGKELRQNDNYHVLFPYDQNSNVIAFGSLDGGSYYSSHRERLLKLQGMDYTVEVELKGEDAEKNTITKKETFRINPLTVHHD